MGVILGWINAGILTALVSIFVLRKTVSPTNMVVRTASKMHPYLAGLLIVNSIIHSHLAWGMMVFNSGHVVFLGILIVAAVAAAGRKFQLKYWYKAHIILPALVLTALIAHIILVG